jgi:hypothetical protein
MERILRRGLIVSSGGGRRSGDGVQALPGCGRSDSAFRVACRNTDTIDAYVSNGAVGECVPCQPKAVGGAAGDGAAAREGQGH